MINPQECEHESIASVGRAYVCTACNIGLARLEVQDVMINDSVDLGIAFRRLVLAAFSDAGRRGAR